MIKDITFLVPSFRGGGVEKVIVLLANELQCRGWIVTILVALHDGPLRCRLSPNISIHELPDSRISRNIFAIARYIDDKKPSILFSSMNYVNIIACIASKFAKYKTVLVVSEHNDIRLVLERSGFWRRFAIKYGILFTYNIADSIVCVSEGVRNGIIDLLKERDKVIVIYNPIEQYEGCTGGSRSTEVKEILAIGRLSDQKNHSLLVRAVDGLIQDGFHNIRLTILGEGPLREALEREISSLGIQDRVHMPGFRDPCDYFRKSDVFVLSSDWEGFGNVLVEALSSGIPVVSTDCRSGPSEILDGGKYGQLVPVNDLDSLKNAIVDTLSRDSNSEDALLRQRRSKEFSVKVITNDYEEFFERLLFDKDFQKISTF